MVMVMVMVMVVVVVVVAGTGVVGVDNIPFYTLCSHYDDHTPLYCIQDIYKMLREDRGDTRGLDMMDMMDMIDMVDTKEKLLLFGGSIAGAIRLDDETLQRRA